MTFLYPIFIYLMLPVTLILFYFIMTGSKESFAMFEKSVLDKLRFQSKTLSRPAREALFLMAFVFMILALAQPVIKEGEVVVEAKSSDILIGIDISDSMKAEDRFPNRLDFAKAKAIELIRQAPHNRIGVLAFAKHDYIVSPLSFDHSSVAFLLSKLKTDNITEKGTRLDSMLSSAIAMLKHAKQKNLLLFTDGGDAQDFSKEIELAQENGLRLFIVGVGTEKGSPVRSVEGDFVKHEGKILISRLNPGMKELATQTGGVYIESVLGEDDIKTMLQEIESMTEKSTMKEETIAQYIQLFYYPLGLAVFFLILAFSSMPKPMAKTFVLLALVSFSIPDARAGLLDFQKLESAKEAYVQEDYTKSRSIYEAFTSPEAVYNLANTLYKQKAYEKALKVFENVKTDSPGLKAKALHNSGNTHVQLKQYKEALHAYEKSLKIKEDKETRENYEAVKKFLEEEQEQKDKQEQKQDEKQKNDKDAEQNKESDQNKDSQESDSKDQPQEQKDQQEKNHDKDAAPKDEGEGSQQKSDKQNNEETRQEKASEEKDKEQEKTGASEQKSDEKLEEKDEAFQQKEQGKAESKEVPVTMQKMSDLEAKKWFDVIKQSQMGHLYKMEDFEHKEDDNEKPW